MQSQPMQSQPMPHRPSQKPPINVHPVHNRIRSFMEHSTRYAFMGEVRLAQDCGVSCAAVSRLLSGKSSPSFALVSRIGHAFEKHFGRPVDLREVISLDGTYPSETVCKVVGCRGCSPQAAWNPDDTVKDDTVKPEYLNTPSNLQSGAIRKEAR